MFKKTRIWALILCVVTLITILIPITALAMDRVTIESDPDTATPRYFEYLNGSGNWVGLKTPRHYIVETGELAYCLQHKMSSPHSGIDFEEADLANWYDTRTLIGLQIILEYGYPCNKPDNLSDDQARYATANAIRFWLSENGDPSFWGFTNRLDNPGNLRATAGNQHVLDWADELTGYARNLQLMQHKVHFSPEQLEFSYQGGYFVGSTSVSLENCNGGYTLDQSSLPAGTIIEGFTGNDGDRLTIKIPATGNGNQTIELKATGIDNRITPNIFMYVTDDSATQNLITISSGGYHPAGAGAFAMKTPAYGKIQLSKSGEDGEKPAGMVFGIYTDSGCTNQVQRLTTGAGGIATSGDLLMGTYYVKELSASAPYILSSTVRTVAVRPAETTNVDVSNKKARGQITMIKTNGTPAMGEYSLEGSVFEVLNSGKIVDTVTVGKDGRGTSKLLPINRTYIVREKTASYGFVLNKNEYPVTLNYAGQTVEVVTGNTTIPNQPQTGKISITKSDMDTGGNPQGDASLYGAKYRIENNKGVVVDRLTALGTRVVTSKALPLGTYKVYEEAPAPEGYLLNPDPVTVTLTYGGQNVQMVGASGTMNDAVKKGYISLVKFGSRELTGGSDPDPDIKPPLAGVEFEVRLKSSGVLYATMETDADGKCTSPALPYGTYVVSELAGESNDGYLKIEPFEVFISENTKTYSYILEDKALELMVRIEKTDAQSGKRIPLAGYTFRIEDSKGNSVSFEILYPQPHTISEFTTDESGSFYLPDTLPAGEYNLYEIDAAPPYLLNTTPLNFSVSDEGTVNRTVTVKFADQVAKGRISVEKKGEMLTDAQTVETEYGTQYIPKYEMRGLDGIVFEIFAAENIGTPDGTVYYREGQKVEELTTMNGAALSKELYLGKYIVKEKSVNGDFILDAKEHEVSLKYEDQLTPVVTETIALENQRQKGEIRMAKQAETFNPDAGIFETVAAEGFVFGVYAKQDIQGVIPQNALVDILITDNEGKAKTAADLPFANYFLKELKAPRDGYVLIEDTFDADITSKNHEDKVFVDDAHEREPFVNEMYKGKVEVIKTDAEDSERKLAGVVFEVLDDSGIVVSTFETDAKGYGISCLLPYGQYTLREAKAKDGFVLADKVWDVSIEKETQIVSFELSNQANEVRLKKIDANSGKPIAGTYISIESADGARSYLRQTDKNGEIVLNEIPAGSYLWRETKPSAGYGMNAIEFRFAIDEYGKVTGETEMTDVPTELQIVKRDGYYDSPLYGAVFNIVGADGKPVLLSKGADGAYVPDVQGGEMVMTENGKAVIRYLPANMKYALREVAAPEGYAKTTAETSFSFSDEYTMENPYRVFVYNLPTAVRINKVNENGRPLTGAGFKLKSSGLIPLEQRFTKIADGWYRYDKNGAETEIMLDENATAIITGLPIAEYWCEESVVPEGYFAAAPVKISITEQTTTDMPLEVTIPNTPFVKLGLDTDQYAGVIAAVTAIAGTAFLVWIGLRSKRARRNKEDQNE